ncbi:MAG: polymer-forming cytoskeletal protein [Acidobacteriota bacterium]
MSQHRGILGRVARVRAAALASSILLLEAAAAAAPPASAGGGSSSGALYVIEEGETHEGDLYLFSAVVKIRGTLDGDLVVGCQRLEVTGVVTGDVWAGAESVVLDGTIRNGVRVGCRSLRVNGLIEGDLIAGCETVRIGPEAHITGDLEAGGRRIEIGGTVDGSVDATGGEVVLEGSVGESAEIEADIVTIDPQARIAGDLDYKSRNRLDRETIGRVGGDIVYLPAERKRAVSTGVVVGWLFCMLTLLVIGLALTALTPALTERTISMVRKDGLRSAGIGFITLIVVPVASLIACVLIVTIPLAILALLIFVIVALLVHLYVAIWLGRSILERAGRAGASLYLALVVGVPVLYVVFAIPVLGTIVEFAATFVGLGALVLAVYEIRQARSSAGSPPPPAL